MKPKIAVVIGAGGLRPLGAVEMFGFFEEEGIKVDLSVGCSGGAVIASVFGGGNPPEVAKQKIYEGLPRDLGHLLNHRKISEFMKIPAVDFSPTKALIEGPVWLNSLKKPYKDYRIEDLTVPTFIQTTDLLSGKGVVFSEGPLAEIVSASCSFFPLFSPLKIGDRYYMDGFFSNPVPVIEAVKRKMDIIIVVNVDSPMNPQPLNVLDAWWSFFRRVDLRWIERENAALFSDFKGKVIHVDIVLEKAIEIWDMDVLPLVFKSFKKAFEPYKKVIMDEIHEFKIAA